MKRLCKGMFKTLLASLAFVFVLAGVCYLIATTNKGFELASAEAIKRIEGLDVTSVDGNLRRGIKAGDVRYENDAMVLTASGVDTAWRLSCLRSREFCLDRAVVDDLYIQSKSTNDEKSPPSDAPIELPTIDLPIDFTAKEVLIKRLRFQAPGDVPEQIVENIRLIAKTDKTQLTLTELSANYQEHRAHLDGSMTLEGDYPLNLTINATAGKIFEDKDMQLKASLSNSVADLNIDADISGLAALQLKGHLNPLEKNLPAKLSITAKELGWPLESFEQAKLSNTNLEIDGTLDDYALRITTSVDGEQIPSSSVQLAGRANTERLTLPTIGIATLGGTVSANAALSWIDTITWNTEMDIADINTALHTPEVNGLLDGKLIAKGTAEDGKWTVDVERANVNGKVRDFPFDLEAKFAKGLDDVWIVESVNLDNSKNRIRANGTVGEQWQLAIKTDLPELQNLTPDLAGGFNADIDIDGPLKTPSVNLDATSQVIKFKDILVTGIRLQADVSELFESDSDVSLALGQLQIGQQTLSNTRLSLNGAREEHAIKLFTDGPQQTAITLDAIGGLSEKFDWLGSLQSVKLEVPAHNIVLEQPTALEWMMDNQQLAIDAHCWQTEETSLCLENKVLALPQGSAVVTLNDYPLERLNPFLPAESTLQGMLNTNATIVWGDDQPGGFSVTSSTRIDAGGFDVVDPNDNLISFSYDDLVLDTQVDPSDIKARLKLTSEALGSADINLQLDPASEEKPISGFVKLEGFDIGVAKAFLPEFDEIDGTLVANGILSGRLTNPRFDGRVVLSEPIVRSPTLPLPITGGTITADVFGKRATLEGVVDSGDGDIAIAGDVNWQRTEDWLANLTLTGDNLTIVQDPVQSATVNHVVNVQAKPGSVRINGDIDIPYADIDVLELPKGAVTLSDDVVIIEDEQDKQEQEAAQAASDTQLRVDLNVSLGDKVNLAAYGLDAELKGDMSLSIQGSNPPQLGGEIEVVDGIYKQYGQDLKANGSVLFVGPVNQSRVSIDAVREIDTESPERVAGLRIKGTVEKPVITLFTDPADKGEDSILSYIVLGRDINETSDEEANLLATAALALTVKGGKTLTSGIAKTLGVDDFDLETRGRGENTEIVVTGRLNDRLLLRYGRSVFQTQNTLYVRYDLTKKLFLEAAQGAESAVDLFYTFSF